jgi:hypothetical protein
VKRWYAYVAGGIALAVITIVLVVTSGGEPSSTREAEIVGPVGIRDIPIQAKPGWRLKRPPTVMDGWREALGMRGGELGRLFVGLTFGERMPPSVQARIDEWQTIFHGTVRYAPNLDTGFPTLEIVFDDRTAARDGLVTLWGQPDLDWGAWSNATGHLLAAQYDNGTQAGVIFTPYATIDELVLPDDPTRLGFEPIAIVGAFREDVEQALTLGIEKTGPTTYRWRPRGLGAGLDVTLTARGGMIWTLETELNVHSKSQGDKLIQALTDKYGDGYHHGDTYSWSTDDVDIKATRRGTGQVSIVVEKRESLKTR